MSVVSIVFNGEQLYAERRYGFLRADMAFSSEKVGKPDRWEEGKKMERGWQALALTIHNKRNKIHFIRFNKHINYCHKNVHETGLKQDGLFSSRFIPSFLINK